MGCAIFFSGYDGRRLAKILRLLMMFKCILGARRGTTLPWRATNSLLEFQKCIDHTIKKEMEAQSLNGKGFIDDVGIIGPKSWYKRIKIVPGIRKAIYEYATILD